MFIDFNSFGDDVQTTEQENSFRNEIIPPKSTVKVKVSMVDSKYGDADCKVVSTFKSGLKGLQLILTVTDGAYKGCRWFQNIWLPEQFQTLQLSDGQKKACQLGGHLLRCIIDAGNELKRSDTSAMAVNKRKISSWYGLDGLTFWATVGVRNFGGKDKQELEAVVEYDSPFYQSLMQNGERISDKPVLKAATNAPQSAFNQSPDFSTSDDNFPF